MPSRRTNQYNKKKYKMKGGSNPSTDGSLDTLIVDIGELAKQTISTVSETANLISYVMDIDSDLNQTYSPNESNAPGNNLSTT
jgi:hypothetical protein